MNKIFAALTLLLFAVGASAQSVSSGGPKPGPVTPSFAMPAGKIFIDTTKIPGRRSGLLSTRIAPGGCTTDGYSATDPSHWPTTPSAVTGFCNSPNSPTVGSGQGAFRIFCGLSHVGFDDPIVWPHQAGRTHLHAFYGNTTTGPDSDVNSMDTVGQSTCMGGSLNRTGYWAPVLIYHCPATDSGCDHAREGEPQVSRRLNAYYKTLDETHGGMSPPLIWPPKGLRMIAGDPNNTNPAAMGDIAYFECWIAGTTPIGANPFVNTPNSYRFDHLPTSADGVALSTNGGQGSGGCQSILMEVVLPQCILTGTPLDSPDHKSHMAYAVGGGDTGGAGGCPNSGGTAGYQGGQIPTISILVHTPVVNADLDHLRLSSDVPRQYAIDNSLACATSGKNYCAGQSAHADWVNGWDQTTIVNSFGENITNVIMRECYFVSNTQFRSCSDGVIGDKDKNGVYWIMY